MGSCLKILRGVPVDSSYQNVLAPHKNYADSTAPEMNYRDALLCYFRSLAIFSTKTTERKFANKTPISYVRESENAVKVNVKRDELEGCNYLMFTNDLTGEEYDGVIYDNEAKKEVPSGADDKYFWHFAFIDSLEYISEGATRVYFSIDVMSTWLPYIAIPSADVLREHVSNDSIGAHIEAEPILPYEYVLADSNVTYTKKVRNGDTDPVSATEGKSKGNLDVFNATNDITVISTSAQFISAKNVIEATDCYVALIYFNKGNLLGIFDYDVVGRSYDVNGGKATYKWTPTSGTVTFSQQDNLTLLNSMSACKVMALRLSPLVQHARSKANPDAYQDREDDFQWLQSAINFITTTLAGEIIAIYCVPYKIIKDLLPDNFLTPSTSITSTNGFSMLNNIEKKIQLTDFKPYTPFSKIIKNKKLLTFPYCSVDYSSINGNFCQTRPERYNMDTKGEIQIECEAFFSFYPEPVLTVKPLNYLFNYDENIAVTSTFPQIPWKENNLISFFQSLQLSSIKSAIVSGYPAVREDAKKAAERDLDPRDAGISIAGKFAGKFAGSMAGALVNAIAPRPSIKGSASPASDIFFGRSGVFVSCLRPSDRDLQRIDDYFTKYGYACAKTKTPNVFSIYVKTTRKSFNYLRCANISITPQFVAYYSGNVNIATMFTTSKEMVKELKMPSSLECEEIRAILARGVTFWEVPKKIGDYSQTNDVRSK